MISRVTLRALEIMRNAGIDLIETVLEKSLLVNIFFLSGPQEYQYQVRPESQPEIIPGDFFYVELDPAGGMHEISENPIYQAQDILLQSPTGEAGTGLRNYVTVYRGPILQFDQAVQRAIVQVEQWTGYSFTGPADYADYRQGEGDLLFLPRIPINSLESVTDLEDCPMDLERIEVDHEAGMLYLKRGSWPRGRLKITANHGFTDYPDEVLEAIALLGANAISGEDEGETGNVMSRSSEGYSESLGPGGKYGGARASRNAQAMTLLGPYITGVG